MEQYTVQLKRTRTIKETKLVTVKFDNGELPIDADEAEEYVAQYMWDTIDGGNEPADWGLEDGNTWELDEEDFEVDEVSPIKRVESRTNKRVEGRTNERVDTLIGKRSLDWKR